MRKFLFLLSIFLLITDLRADTTNKIEGTGVLRDNYKFQEFSDVVYGKAGDFELKMDIFVPDTGKEKNPAVLMIHGGGWTGGDKVQQAHFRQWSIDYAKMGVVAFNINYRLAKDAPAPAAVEDALRAFRYILDNAEKYHVNPAKVFVTGGSAGSHLALMVAFSPDPQRKFEPAAVINQFGITDAYDLTYGKHATGWALAWFKESKGDKQELAKEMSPINYVTRSKLPPVLTIHGTADKIVPYSQAETLHKLLVENGHSSILLPVPNGEHGLTIKDKVANQKMTAEVKKVTYKFLLENKIIE
jgi:acetyl esterase/lipase